MNEPGGRDLHIPLLEPEIHFNTGNAGRTCLAVSAQLHLIEPLGFDLDAREVRRAGLDYWPRVKPLVWSGWNGFQAARPDLGPAFFCTPDAERELWDVSFPRPCALVFGCESSGLPERLRRDSPERCFRIPMADTTLRSLNLSTCVGIAAYEVVRQWRVARAPLRGGPR